MIPANKKGPLGALWRRYVDGKLARTFRGVWLRGTLPSAPRGILVYANHGSFWDGFALHALARGAGWDGYCMMEEANLARWPFLARIGAFSVVPGDARSAVASVRYARGLLAVPGAMVGCFPEGVLTAGGAGLQPLRRGVELLARAPEVTCVPLGIRCAFFEHEKPDLLLELGAPHGAATLPHFEQALAAQVSAVMGARSLEGFALLRRGRPGVAERWRGVFSSAGGS